jgi:hypothetical protein
MKKKIEQKFKTKLTTNGKLVYAAGSLMTLPSGSQYVVLSSGQWVRVDNVK